MKTIRFPFFLIVLIQNILLCVGYASAQTEAFEIPVTNTRGKILQRVAATDIEVVYNRPSVKGRKIFGELIPFDQVWRTGSDASTKVSFSTPVSINGQSVAPGTYELFTIPGKKEWTIILQLNRNQWGSYSYKSEFDVLRTTVKSIQLSGIVESFTISIDNITSKSADISLAWEHTWVAIPITIDLMLTVVPLLEESLTKEGKKPYFRAAMFYYENDLDINRAAQLMELAVQENPNHLGMLYRQALILERKGDRSAAIAAAEKSLAEAQQAAPELKAEYVKLNTALLLRLKNQ